MTRAQRLIERYNKLKIHECEVGSGVKITSSGKTGKVIKMNADADEYEIETDDGTEKLKRSEFETDEDDSDDNPDDGTDDGTDDTDDKDKENEKKNKKSKKSESDDRNQFEDWKGRLLTKYPNAKITDNKDGSFTAIEPAGGVEVGRYAPEESHVL